MRVIFLFCCFLLFNFNAFSQEVNLTQTLSNAGFVNPAFVGLSANPKLYFTYRDQWLDLFTNAILGYEQRISPKAGFIGAYLFHDQAGRGISQSNMGALQYAYHFKVDDDVSFRLGVSAGIFQKSLDTRRVVVQNGIEPDLDISDSTRRVLKTDLTFTMSFGSVFIYRNFFVGAAIQHLNRPAYSYFKNSARLDAKYTLHAGSFFALQQTESPFILSPFVVFEHRPATLMGVITAGANINKGIFTVGASLTHALTNPASINFLVGASIKRFRIGYTYEIPARKFEPFGVSHELTMAFYFGKPREGTHEGLPYYFRKCGF